MSLKRRNTLAWSLSLLSAFLWVCSQFVQTSIDENSFAETTAAIYTEETTYVEETAHVKQTQEPLSPEASDEEMKTEALPVSSPAY